MRLLLLLVCVALCASTVHAQNVIISAISNYTYDQNGEVDIFFSVLDFQSCANKCNPSIHNVVAFNNLYCACIKKSHGILISNGYKSAYIGCTSPALAGYSECCPDGQRIQYSMDPATNADSCVPCADHSAITCTATDSLTCQSPFVPSGSPARCKCADLNALTCTSSASLTCKSGFALVGNECKCADVNALTCDSGASLTCKIPFTLVENKCLCADVNAITCTVSASLTCKNSFTLVENECKCASLSYLLNNECLCEPDRLLASNGHCACTAGLAANAKGGCECPLYQHLVNGLCKTS
jgi:hypothetical protein